MVKSIAREALKAELDAGAPVTLVEALPEKYWLHAHLPGALRLNHDEVEARAAEVLPDREARLVVYCAGVTCENSHKAAAALEALGYRDVSVYAEGKQDWIDAGLPVEGEARFAAAG
ncbi:MAG: rhodanese-like domain-containing protein [Proteobacteria bacterium]|nr:rhodanese-like domain-containing protein [Pseudomonadota bacterium]